jgi:lysophospholipase L1-like esterase
MPMFDLPLPRLAIAGAMALGLLAAVPASARQAGVWREAHQSSPAAYDPLDPAFEKVLIERFKVPAAMLETMRPKPPVVGTIRTRLAVSIAGSHIRVRFSNEAGTRPMTIAAASVGLAGEGLAAVPGSLRPLTFGGARNMVIPAGAPVLSDPVELAVAAHGELVVSAHLPDGVQLDARGGGMMALAEGDQTTRESADGAKSLPGRPLVSGVEVLTGNAPRVIVAFGDSITDGNRSKPGVLRGWPDELSRRFSACRRCKPTSVVNAGIGGNRVLSPGWGPSALARFDRDVLRIEGVSHVIVLEGVNDIGMSGKNPVYGEGPPLSAGELIAGYRQLIARAHARNIKLVMATILPMGGSLTHSSPEKEAIRQAVNAWIRTSNEPDAVIDFDALARDPADPARMAKSFGSVDNLHPGDAGYKAMGDAIDLAIFK